MQAQDPEPNGGFVATTALADGSAAMVAPLQPSLKSRTKEVGFQVLTGSIENLLESLEAGATGAILGIAAFAPQACHEVYLAFKDRDFALAAAKQQRIATPSQRIVGELGIAGIKYACDFNGYYGGRVRSPLLPLAASEPQPASKGITWVPAVASAQPAPRARARTRYSLGTAPGPQVWSGFMRRSPRTG